MGDRNRTTRILCVNCNVCINKLRRYPALALDTRVTSLLCSWAYPYIITEKDYICETCRDLAMSAVNNQLQEDVHTEDQSAAGPSNRHDIGVCLTCGCRFGNKQKELEQSIINVIESTVAPLQVTESHRVCHACWLRFKKQVQRDVVSARVEIPENIQEEPQVEEYVVQDHQIQDEQEEIGRSVPSSTIILPEYKRAANCNNYCVFRDCNATHLHTISDKLRALMTRYISTSRILR